MTFLDYFIIFFEVICDKCGWHTYSYGGYTIISSLGTKEFIKCIHCDKSKFVKNHKKYTLWLDFWMK